MYIGVLARCINNVVTIYNSKIRWHRGSSEACVNMRLGKENRPYTFTFGLDV